MTVDGQLDCGLLGVVCGNTPEARTSVLDRLRVAWPEAAVLSVSVQGDEDERYPYAQRLASCRDQRLRDALCQGATGDPAVILRQDLTAIARATPAPHVLLALLESLDVMSFLSFLADLWRAPINRTPIGDYHDIAPIAVGVEPGRLLEDLRCVHRTARTMGRGAHAVPVTVAEAAARAVEAAGSVFLTGEGGDTDDHGGVGALLAHLSPSAELHADVGRVSDDGLAGLGGPSPQWGVARPADRLDPVAVPVRRRGVDQGVQSVLWQSRRPLHPERLADCLDTVMSGVVRSRGHVWLPTCPEEVVSWRSAGRHIELREAGRWLEDFDASGWRDASPLRRTLASWFWDDLYGERRNELVFTGGPDLDQDRLRAALDLALLDDEELSRGADFWRHRPPAPGCRRSPPLL